MAEGKSKRTAAVEMGVTEHTFHNWAKKFPDFLQAVKIGENLCRRWWEEIGRLNLHNKGFNNVGWMMNMQNRFGWNSNKGTGLPITDEGIELILQRDEVIKVEHQHVHKHEVNLGERTDEHLATVLRILVETGGLEAAAEEAAARADDKVH